MIKRKSVNWVYYEGVKENQAVLSGKAGMTDHLAKEGL